MARRRFAKPQLLLIFFSNRPAARTDNRTGKLSPPQDKAGQFSCAIRTSGYLVRNGRSVPFGGPGFGGILRQHPRRPGLLFHHTCVEVLVLPGFGGATGSTHVFIFLSRVPPEQHAGVIDIIVLVSCPSRCIFCFVSISVQLSRRFARSVCALHLRSARICFASANT